MSAWLWARSRWRRWPSLALIAVLITLTGGVTLSALNAARRADTAFDRFVRTTGEPDLGAQADFDTGPVDLVEADSSVQLFEQAATLPGVRSATALSLWVVTPGPELQPWQFGVARTTAGPSGLLVHGRWPSPAAADEVVLNEAAAAALGVEAGDHLTLQTAAPSQAQAWEANYGFLDSLDGPQIPVTVTGIARGIEDIAQVEDLTISFTPAFFDTYRDSVLHCACFTMFVVDDGARASVQDELERLYGPLGFVVEPMEGGVLPEQAADGITVEVTALRLLALVAGAAGVVVVAQAMARQLAGSGGDRRARRAFGTTSRQIARADILVLTPTLLAGGVGAVVLAVLTSPLFPRGLAAQAEAEPGVWVDRAVLAGGILGIVVVGLAVTAAVAFWSASPARGASTHLLPLPTHLAPPARLGFAFATRPGRGGWAAITSALVATAVATAGVLGVWSFEASRNHLLGEPRLFGLDATLAIGGVPPETVRTAAAAAATHDGVAGVVLEHTLDHELTARHGEATAAVSPDALEQPVGTLGYTVVAGRSPAGPAEVAIGRGIGRRLGAGVGDALEVVADPPIVLTVVGEVVAWGNDEVDEAFELTPTGLDALAQACADDGCGATAAAAAVKLGRGSKGRAAERELREAGWSNLPAPTVVDNLGQAGSVPMVLGVFLAVVGAAGLAHALVVSLRSRRRDVAVARALGLGSRGARWSLRWTAVVLAIGGLLVGVPVGIAIGRIAWNRVVARLGVVPEQALPLWAPLAVGLLVVALGLLLAELPARRAGAIRPADILRGE